TLRHRVRPESYLTSRLRRHTFSHRHAALRAPISGPKYLSAELVYRTFATTYMALDYPIDAHTIDKANTNHDSSLIMGIPTRAVGENPPTRRPPSLTQKVGCPG